MTAPNLIAFYSSPLSADPLLARRPQNIRGLYESGKVEKDGPCDWVDAQTGPDWQSAQTGPDWQSAQTGPDWQSAQTGPDWQDAASGSGWKSDKDCD